MARTTRTEESPLEAFIATAAFLVCLLAILGCMVLL